MKDLDINCVVNVAFECDNLFEADFTYSNFPFEDHPSSILTSGFDDACETIARHMHLSLTSIVHCSDGNNRSAAFCIAYLMRKKRATLKQAWNLVKNVRPTVNLHQEYFQQLLWYERQVHGSNTMSESDFPSFAQMHRSVV
jgi:protein-tyrosine phosphatase